MTRPACVRGERQHVRTWPGHWSVSRYKMLYRGGGQPCVTTRAATRSSTPYDTAQERCYTAPSALRDGVGALRHALQLALHGAQCARQGFDSRYNFFYRDRGTTTRCATRLVSVATRPEGAQRTACPQPGHSAYATCA